MSWPDLTERGLPSAAAGGRAGVNAPPAKRRGMAAPERGNAGDRARPGHGHIPCSHAALDAAGSDRAVEYLRSLLVRYGLLPPRDRRLADFQRWAAAKLEGVGNAGHRQLLERFLRWRLLRHLRSGSTAAAPLGHGPYQRAKQRLTVAIAFLAWLDGRGRHLGDCTQHDLDKWFGTGPTTRRHVITFLPVLGPPAAHHPRHRDSGDQARRGGGLPAGT